MNEWNFKDDAEPVSTSDFFYDMFEGGYISPEALLAEDEQSDKVIDAMHTIISFKQAMDGVGLIELM